MGKNEIMMKSIIKSVQIKNEDARKSMTCSGVKKKLHIVLMFPLFTLNK